MQRKLHNTAWSNFNDGSVSEEDGDTRLLQVDGEWEMPTSMEEMLAECGLSFSDYNRNNYE